MTGEEEFWDDLFLGCAFAAFVEEAAEQAEWPDSEATRRRAYRYYEEALALKNRRREGSAPPPTNRLPPPRDGG
ncbi:MAG TPA: hypothetical protein VFW33_06870 [Gemmataceae bacterium]|nr:hypothetical protein [Gemmataceae bacterium]